MSFLQSNGLIRLIAVSACILLFSAAVTVSFEAMNHPRPFFQIPSVLLTGMVGLLVFYASYHAVSGNRVFAVMGWFLCLLVILGLIYLQFLPMEYDTVELLRLKSMSPPIWPYTFVMPLLVFLILETALPSNNSIHSSVMFLVIGLFASILLLFMSTVLISSVANISELIFMPERLFGIITVPLLASFAAIFGLVAVRKGFLLFGVGILFFVGLATELISTWAYSGPYFIETSNRIFYKMFPMLPIVAGTIPGILIATSGLVAIRDSRVATFEHVSTPAHEVELS
ncbi:MAG: hypothetical protein FI729_05655 [SAR202 cluster bacterium]|nr:hypothetical protein [SAR202 cluster bacterium]|tara:strand:- start:6540 stop:7394 length:855 start_codon:yes stop_codon:yes gene_type:complete